MEDKLRTLLFEKANCKGQVVQLHKAWQHVASHNESSAAAQHLLGELVAASALLSASLKFEGSLILQVQGDGPVRLLVAECNNELGLRATMKLAPGCEIPKQASFKELVNRNGKGLCVLVLDPKNRQPGQAPYQGIVPLEGNSIAESIENYMRASEQVDTQLKLWAKEDTVAGIMLQKMPNTGGKAKKPVRQDDWETLTALMATTQAQEMLEIDTETLSRRLFHELEPQLIADREPCFHCTCSRNKVAHMLLKLGQDEAKEALKEQPNVVIHCDFCNTAYVFTPKQCEELFSNDEELDPVPDDVVDCNPMADLRREGSNEPTIH